MCPHASRSRTTHARHGPGRAVSRDRWTASSLKRVRLASTAASGQSRAGRFREEVERRIVARDEARHPSERRAARGSAGGDGRPAASRLPDTRSRRTVVECHDQQGSLASWPTRLSNYNNMPRHDMRGVVAVVAIDATRVIYVEQWPESRRYGASCRSPLRRPAAFPRGASARSGLRAASATAQAPVARRSPRHLVRLTRAYVRVQP